MYLYHEDKAKKGTDEICSFLFDCLENVSPKIRTICLFSNNGSHPRGDAFSVCDMKSIKWLAIAQLFLGLNEKKLSNVMSSEMTVTSGPLRQEKIKFIAFLGFFSFLSFFLIARMDFDRFTEIYYFSQPGIIHIYRTIGTLHWSK